MIRAEISIFAARTAAFLLRLTGRKATTLPGSVALKLYPQILEYLGSKLQGRILFVTGTNGKTTTSNLVSQFLIKDGHDVISNALGANLIQGITAALIDGIRIVNVEQQIAVLEVDEATLPKVVQPLQPKAIVVTNFFRDQMDRYGEVESVVRMVENAMRYAPQGCTVILNADDPLVASIAPPQAHTLYYGIESTDIVADDVRDVRDGKFCRKCGSSLQYSLYYYGQLGIYTCPSCEFTRPDPVVVARNLVISDGGIRFTWNEGPGFLHSPAFYNVYNALAAVTAATVLGVSKKVLVQGMQQLSTGLGRMERIVLTDGTKVMLALVKNPTGMNQVIRVLGRLDQETEAVLILNDRYADGTDVSWVWDTDLESLQQAGHIHRITVGGTRMYDMAVRLRYAGLGDKVEIAQGDIAAVEQALKQLDSNRLLFICTTYTSLYAIRDHLLSKGRAPVEN